MIHQRALSNILISTFSIIILPLNCPGTLENKNFRRKIQGFNKTSDG